MAADLMCIRPIPSRKLYAGKMYTELDRVGCKPGCRVGGFVSVAESRGRTRHFACAGCKTIVARSGPNGWYRASRFVLIDPKRLGVTLTEVKELYRSDKVGKPKRSKLLEKLLDISWPRR